MITFKNLGCLGRFANGMFQIAGTIGIAKANGYDFCFPEWKNYDHGNFAPGEEIDVQKYFVNPLPVGEDLGRFPDQWVNWGYHGLKWPDNISLNGHFQSPKYFMHCIETVRHYFRMKDEPEQNDYVAVHFRAGDYVDDPNAYHPRCTKEYYEKAMALFPDDTIFVVFSDNNDEWMKIQNSFMFPRKSCEIKIVDRGLDYINSFKLMKRCKSFICANSSYSLMAAILGEHPEKKIVCPKVWFGPVAGISGDDCYPENAIVI